MDQVHEEKGANRSRGDLYSARRRNRHHSAPRAPRQKESDRCEPLPEAGYVKFTSYGLDQFSYGGKPRQPFYEVIDLILANHAQTILAYQLNDEPVPLSHGAPLRLRVETQLGYKMVKYLCSIELIADYRTIGEGQGGSREDTMFYGRGAEI